MSKKSTICPGCGKIEEKEDIYFNIEVLERETKEIKKKNIHGIKWCFLCK
jgi:hypothetical protein